MRITKSRLVEIITEEAHQMGVIPEADTEYRKASSEKYDKYFGNDLTLGNIRAIVQETIEEQIKNEFKRVYERISTLEQALAAKSDIKPDKAPIKPTAKPSPPIDTDTPPADDWQMRAMADNAFFPLPGAPNRDQQLAKLKAKYSKGSK